MNKHLHIAAVVCLVLAGFSLNAQTGIGRWRDHFSYNRLNHIETEDDHVYASSSGGLICLDLDDNTLTLLNKTTTLNDAGIETFAYDVSTKCLVVAYTNSNIDIVKNDRTYNLADIKRSDIAGSKLINNISFSQGNAYLACGFGIVVVDLARMEIKETYYIGTDGTYLNINDIAFTDSLIVAATDAGIMYANRQDRFLNLSSNWHSDTSSLLSGQPVQALDVAGGRLWALSFTPTDTTLYADNGDLAFAPMIIGDVRGFNTSNDIVTVTRAKTVETYTTNMEQLSRTGDVDWMNMDAVDACVGKDGRLWIAHSWAGLVSLVPSSPGTSLRSYTPQGPWNDNSYRLVSYGNRMMVCPGGHTTTYSAAYLPANIYIFENEQWQMLDNSNGMLDGLHDVLDVSVNPRDGKTMAAATWGQGILEITGNVPQKLYNSGNSDGALTPYRSGSYETLLTGSTAYDQNGDLWIANSLQENGLAVHRRNGTWQKYNTISMTGGTDIDNLLCDSVNGYKIFWGRANKIFVHNGDSLMAYIDPNNGSKLTTSSVQSVVQDHSGNLWIGTNKGIKVVYNLHSAFQNGGRGEKSPIACSNILYNENDINEYLLAYENVTCMAVDGANRKWVGTATGGIYLLSGSGLSQIEHFTSSNSPLFSDKIKSIAVMPWSGEVFISTDKGLQSYRGNATYASDVPMDDIHAFPNPVRPNYDGPIAIKGFSRNALVHITDAAGHTVYSTTANGGQAVWNGRTLSGERVASGIYYVFASSTDGSMRSVAKIMVIR